MTESDAGSPTHPALTLLVSVSVRYIEGSDKVQATLSNDETDPPVVIGRSPPCDTVDEAMAWGRKQIDALVQRVTSSNPGTRATVIPL